MKAEDDEEALPKLSHQTFSGSSYPSVPLGPHLYSQLYLSHPNIASSKDILDVRLEECSPFEIAILHPEKSISYSCLQSSLKIKPYVLAILLKEGKKNPLKKELAVYAPATMMSYGEGVKLQ